MSVLVPEAYKRRLRRLGELSKLLPKVLENKGSDEDVLTVFSILYVFRPKSFFKDPKKSLQLVNVLASRGMYEEARKVLELSSKDVAKAIIAKLLASETEHELAKLVNMDLEAMKAIRVPEVLHGSKDKRLLELARKYLTPKNFWERLWVIREAFYGSSDDDAISFLASLLKRYRDKSDLVLRALVDIWEEPDRYRISKELGEEDLRRLVIAGGKSKKVLAKIEDALIEGLRLGRIGQLLRDHPELMPTGEYILEKRLRRKIPEDEQRGTYLRALHFFPTIPELGEKLLYLLGDAIEYAIKHEDNHLLRIAVSQLADLKVHSALKASVLTKALKQVEQSDRFFDAVDIILRHVIFDELLAAEVARVVAESLPDVRALIAVFGDALARLLSSPAAFEVFRTLYEAKKGDKALGELLSMIKDERSKIRASVMLGDYSGFDPLKVLLYAYDLLKPEELKALLKQVEFEERILPAIKRAIEAIKREDLERFLEKLSKIKKASANIFVLLAAKFGDELLEKLMDLDDLELDYDSAETLAVMAYSGSERAMRLLEKFVHKETIMAAIATVFRGSKKVLELAEKLEDKRSAAALIAHAFENTNDVEAALKALELSGDPSLAILIAPDALTVSGLYEKLQEAVERIVQSL